MDKDIAIQAVMQLLDTLFDELPVGQYVQALIEVEQELHRRIRIEAEATMEDE